MDFFLTCDVAAETGVSKAIDDLSGPARYWFDDKQYGDGLIEIGIVLMCRSPHLKFKQRITFCKSERSFLLDIMLDYQHMVRDQESGKSMVHLKDAKQLRERIIRERLVAEVPAVLQRYTTRRKDPLKDFDVDRFEADLRLCFLGGGLEKVIGEYEEELAWLRSQFPPGGVISNEAAAQLKAEAKRRRAARGSD